jgi:vacuolar-type H+-ATPase subunit I/STV1
MIILIAAGIVAGVIGAVIANFALIVVGAILMSIPLILKFINDLILEEWLIAIIPGLSLVAIAFLYIWTAGLSSAAADAIDRPVLWVVVGVGIIQLLWISLVFREV